MPKLCLCTFFSLRVGVFENRLIKANPGLKVYRSIIFFSIKVFFASYVLFSLTLHTLKQYKQKPHRKKMFANPGLA